jgi:hypothetical protein
MLSKRSWYSYWLWAGQMRDWSLSPGKIKNLFHGIQTKLTPTQPPSQWVPGVRRPEHEPGHSPPSSAKIKKVWIYTFIPMYTFMMWCLIS